MTYKNKPKPINKMVIGTYISIITLNINGLNAPTKRHRLAECIQKQDPYACCGQETHFRVKYAHKFKVRGWKKIFHANGNQKAGVAILILDKTDFLKKSTKKDKDGHFIMMKRINTKNLILHCNIYIDN